jgi:hypothetical protein
VVLALTTGLPRILIVFGVCQNISHVGPPFNFLAGGRRLLIKVRSQVPVEQGEGGLKTKSFIKCEAIRSISTERLRSRWGMAPRSTMIAVEDCLRILMNL